MRYEFKLTIYSFDGKQIIPVEEIIAGLEDCAFDDAVQRAYTQERNNLSTKKNGMLIYQ